MQQLRGCFHADPANAESARRRAQALLQALLQVDPAQRATAAAVCRHPWALDLPESPPGSPSRSLYCSPQRHADFQDPPERGGCGSSRDGATAEQQGVECTAEAMQQLWLQQEVLLQGAQPH
jgi:serine/threonine protein kinase